MGSLKTNSAMLLLFYAGFCFAQSPLTLLDSTFDDFLKEVIPSEDQQDFSSHFQNLRKDLKKHFDGSTKKFIGKEKDLKKMQQKISTLQEQGRVSVEVKNAALANDLKKTLCSKHLDKTQEKKIKTLWYRFGAYEEFLQQKAAKQKSILTKTKSYMRDAGNKVISWVSTLRGSKITT